MISKFETSLAKKAFLFAAIFSIASALNGNIKFTSGFILGTTVAVLNLFLLAITINKSLKMSAKDCLRFTRQRYMIRFMISGITLALAFRNGSESFWGAVFGLLMVKIVIFSEYFWDAFIGRWFAEK